MNAVEIKNLTKDYGDFILDNISFSIPQGCIMGLIGENGAGKSSTINCIINEVEKTSGEILLWGEDHMEKEQLLKQNIGVILDECVFPVHFNLEQIEKIMRTTYRNWDSDCYFKYIKQFDLPRNKEIEEFSRGMKIKAAFAVALSHDAKLLILDEATSGLDPIVRDDILEMLMEYIQDENHSVLFSSHITADMEKIADYITFVHHGKKLFTLPKDELLEQYGMLNCTHDQFFTMDKADILAYRRQDYQVQVLVKNRRRITEKYPQLEVNLASIDDIMVMYVKGEKQ